MNDKERIIELANAINDYFVKVLEDTTNHLRKTDKPYDFIVKALKKASYNLKGYVEFSDEVDDEAKEPLKDFIDAMCQRTIDKVEAICPK